jgi:hypothetical protein
MLIGAVTALALVTLGQLALSLAIGRSLFSLGAATYLFWFGLPGLLHICAGAVGGWRLNLHSVARPHIASNRSMDGTFVEQRA